MRQQPTFPDSIVACVNKPDGTVVKVGTASSMIGPALVDPTHLMLGVGCGDWGVCIYLSLADAAMLHLELGALMNDQSNRG
jgi:energy-converting hydrogenase Eha subunit E